jgi:coenzyme F420-0:L-glutamate ligase/coenzyme F420-1:gamma-L-glutamate ligase
MTVLPPRYEIIGITGLPEIKKGDELGRLIVEAAALQATPLRDGDLLVVSQKVVSKAEGRVVRLADATPSPAALAMARELGKDPRLVELILRESRRVVRMDKGVLIVETHHGWICANAGVDQSNVDMDAAALLPEDPDRSARALGEQIRQCAGADVAIIVSDTFGRPWREGLTNVAIGLAGLHPIRSYLGARDPAGHTLQATLLAVADELAGAAEPIMGKLNRVPATIIRGLTLERGENTSKALLRDPSRDLFR